MCRTLIAIAALAPCLTAATPLFAQSTSAQHAAAVRYACPMKCEGDKTYDAPGKCPICRMKLKAVPAGPTLTVKPDGELKANEPAKLTLTLATADGQPAPDAAPAQVVIVARDLSWFSRPPARQLDHGQLTLTQTLAPGEYRIFVDAAPAKGDAIQASAPLTVPGKPPVPKAMGADTNPVRTVEGLTARLDGASGLVVGRRANLQFHLTGNAPQPARPASADHLTAVSQDLQQCALADASPGGSLSDPAFTVTLDRPGLYRLWAEFPRGDRSILIPFTVEVHEPGAK